MVARGGDRTDQKGGGRKRRGRKEVEEEEAEVTWEDRFTIHYTKDTVQDIIYFTTSSINLASVIFQDITQTFYGSVCYLCYFGFSL